jgi:copper chaperone CopZ
LLTVNLESNSYVGTIERALSNTPGVVSAEISLILNTASVDIGSSELLSSSIIEIIEDLGFDASLLEEENQFLLIYPQTKPKYGIVGNVTNQLLR